MKDNKSIGLLVLFIAVLAGVATIYGIISSQSPHHYDFQTLRGEVVSIYGTGLYKYDSVSAAVQMIAQDMVTVGIGIPLLLVSLVLSNKGSLRGKLLLTGTLGYFLYTYISYTFLAQYNPLFLIYVALMSASLSAFILSFISLNNRKRGIQFSSNLPVRFIGSFLIILSGAVMLMWLGKLAPSLLKSSPPTGLEHYTTMVIQAMDLGLIVPAGMLSGVLFLRRHPLGYLLGTVILIKGITLLTAITAMIFFQAAAGVHMSFFEITVFPCANIVVVYPLFLVLKHVQNHQEG